MLTLNIPNVLLADLTSSPLVMQFAIFGSAAAVAWWLLDFMSSRKPRTDQRLQDIREPNTRKSDMLAKGKGGAMAKVLERATPALSKPMQSDDEEEMGKTKNKLMMAGFRSETAPQLFHALRMLGLFGGFFLGGGAVILTRGFDTDSLIWAGGIACVCVFLPSIVVYIITKGRQDNIFYGLPDALDLMVVCVEAGLGLDQAMRKVSEEMKKTYHVIAEEFSLCNLQLQMGRARNDVLHDLGARTGVDDLKALAAILDSSRQVRLQCGSGAACAERLDADPSASAGRRKSGQDCGEADLPARVVHLPGNFHRASRPRCDHDDQRAVPLDEWRRVSGSSGASRHRIPALGTTRFLDTRRIHSG